MTQTLLFVCPHGAGMSRIAAAWFNLVAPSGWQAISAGIEPQADLGVNAPRVLAGTPAEAYLDREQPRSIDSAGTAAHVIGLCCDVPGAVRWDLEHREFSDAMCDEIRARVEALASGLSAGMPSMTSQL